MKKFIITQELGDALIQYLGTKPWYEVNDLILALQNLENLTKTKCQKNNKK